MKKKKKIISYCFVQTLPSAGVPIGSSLEAATFAVVLSCRQAAFVVAAEHTRTWVPIAFCNMVKCELALLHFF